MGPEGPAPRSRSESEELRRAVVSLPVHGLFRPPPDTAVLWNTVQVECVAGCLRADGADLGPADLARVWPLQHALHRPGRPPVPGLAAGRAGRGGTDPTSRGP